MEDRNVLNWTEMEAQVTDIMRADLGRSGLQSSEVCLRTLKAVVSLFSFDTECSLIS